MQGVCGGTDEMMGDFGRTEPGESQGLLDSPFTSGSSNRKAESTPTSKGHIPQLPNKGNVSLTTNSHAWYMNEGAGRVRTLLQDRSSSEIIPSQPSSSRPFWSPSSITAWDEKRPGRGVGAVIDPCRTVRSKTTSWS